MYIPGTSGNDILIGTDGDDHFDGGAGDDTFQGGLDDDYYIVNSDGDQVSESANQGVDTVASSVDYYPLPSNVENLYLTGSATVGVGNNDNNYLVANAALGSELNGLGGDDVLMGGAGIDTLNGGAGDDYLDGGAGGDVLIGGLGDDYYIVDNTLDQVVEASGADKDNVLASANYTLSANVENLFLTGGATVGTGNSGDNYLVANQTLASTLNGLGGNDVMEGSAGNDTLNGGAGNDYLDGGAGNDILNGGAGNDYYVVDSTLDQIVEASSVGLDSVTASVNYTLSANVENLSLTGNAVVGKGNSGDNFLVANPTLSSILYGYDGNDLVIGGTGDDTLLGFYGNDNLMGGDGNDFLVGDPGNDTLTGGAGNDSFFYGGVEGSLANYGVDVIIDFTSGQDLLQLSSFTFEGLTAIKFASVTSDVEAATSDANIVYNSISGNLFYNQDGVTDSFGSGGIFATLASNLTLAATDFAII